VCRVGGGRRPLQNEQTIRSVVTEITKVQRPELAMLGSGKLVREDSGRHGGDVSFSFFNETYALSGAPKVSENPNVILLLLMLLYLILGCFMEAIAIIVMTIPVVMPVLKQVGVDPVHFGVILAVNMSLGTITPPLGIVMYVMSDIAKVSVNEFTRAVLPFFASLFALLILFTLVPQFVTLLSSLVGN
jgi:hypothetical protein